MNPLYNRKENLQRKRVSIVMQGCKHNLKQKYVFMTCLLLGIFPRKIIYKIKLPFLLN